MKILLTLECKNCAKTFKVEIIEKNKTEKRYFRNDIEYMYVKCPFCGIEGTIHNEFFLKEHDEGLLWMRV